MNPLSLLPLPKSAMPSHAALLCKDSGCNDSGCNAKRLSLLGFRHSSSRCTVSYSNAALLCSVHHSMIADMVTCTSCCEVAIMLFTCCMYAIYIHTIRLFAHAIMLFRHVVMLLRRTIVLFMHALIATLQLAVKHQDMLLTAILLIRSHC